MENKKIIILIAISFVAGLFGGIFAQLVFFPEKNSKDKIIADFYSAESTVHVSPHGLRKEIAKGTENFVLVDLRSSEEYEIEHIVGAINVPAYKDKDNSDYGAKDRIVASFKEIKKNNPDKDIIVYCYSAPCMTGRKIGNMLAEEGIYVKSLNIGWNEWRYHWNLWNHEHEWNSTSVKDYISKGKNPGEYKSNSTNSSICPIAGSLGC